MGCDYEKMAIQEESMENEKDRIVEIVEKAMFQSPTTALSMSTLVFNQIVRDQILNEITGDKENKLFITKE